MISKKEGRHSCESLEELEKGGAAAIAKNPNFKMPSALSNMLDVEVSIKHDTQSEDQIKNTYAKIAASLNGSLKPEVHGVNNTLEAGKDIPNVGDWAFTTNVVSVNMGAGPSTRGRLLEARQGALRLTLSVNIGPDPGADKLDTEMGDLARSAVAKMK